MNIQPDILRRTALSHLTGPEIVRLCQVEKYVNRALCGEEKFWEALFRRDLSDAQDEQENYLRTATDYKKAYADAWRNMPKNLDKKDRYAALHGYEKLLKPPFDEPAIAGSAAQGGHTDIFMTVTEKAPGYVWSSLASTAAEYGRGDILTYILKKSKENPSVRLAAIDGAAISGRRSIIRWMLRAGPELNPTSVLEKILYGAAAGNQLQLVQLVTDPETQWEFGESIDEAVNIAAAQGSIDVLDYLLDRYTDPNDRNSTLEEAIKEAASSGQLPTLQHLFKDVSVPITGETVVRAAQSGSIPTFDYAFANIASPPRETDEKWRHRLTNRSLDAAADVGQIPMMKHLLGMGGEITEVTIDKARSRKKVILFIHENMKKTPEGLLNMLKKIDIAGLYKLLPEIARSYPKEIVREVGNKIYEAYGSAGFKKELDHYLETA